MYGLKKCFLMVTIAVMLSPIHAISEKTVVPLFLFSGQSNMVCLGSSVSDLPSEERNKTYENIKIHNRSDQARQGWSTLKPGFGGDANHFGPELYFGKVLSDSMPETKFAFIKDASSGTYLGKSDGWLPPSSGGPGTLYRNMMQHIDNALKEFNEAFDTSEYIPRWAGFVWHQGEFDGWNDQGLANKYEENLTNLINDIRDKAEDDSMPAIIPMITGNMWQYLNIVRAAEIAVADKLVNTDTTDTDGFALASDGIHFNAESQIKIGTNCALRWLAMEYTEEWWTPTVAIASPPVPLTVAGNGLFSNFRYFDLAGRMVSQSSMVTGDARKNVSIMMLVRRSIHTQTAERKTSREIRMGNRK